MGKAAAALAEGAVRALGRRIAGGLLVAPAGAVSPPGFRALVAAHPQPNASSLRAGREIWRVARALDPALRPLVLLSGGASAIAVLPAAGVAAKTKLAVHRALLRSGLSIGEVNAIRAHLSSLKGGGMLRALSSRPVQVEVLSDVGSGAIDPVGSGPCSPDPTTFRDCREAAAASGVALPPAALRHLEAGARGEWPETTKAGDPLLEGVVGRRLAGPLDLRDAAVRAARSSGFRVVPREAAFAGDWLAVREEISRWLAAPAPDRPTLWVAAGEPRVALPRFAGAGGRAQQIVLSLLPEIGERDAALLVAGSDGRDGFSAYAGAAADRATWRRALALGLDLPGALRRFDASPALAALGAVLPAAPARTNLTDLFLLARGPAK